MLLNLNAILHPVYCNHLWSVCV